MNYEQTSASGRELMPVEMADIRAKHGSDAEKIITLANGAIRISGGYDGLDLPSRLHAAKRHVKVGQVFEASTGAWLRLRGQWMRIQ